MRILMLMLNINDNPLIPYDASLFYRLPKMYLQDIAPAINAGITIFIFVSFILLAIRLLRH